MIATHLVRRACAALFLSVFAFPLLAQQLTVPAGVASGAEIPIQYTNAAMAGKRVVITATGGNPTTTVEIIMTLDAQGQGATGWTAPPGWTTAYLSAPGCEVAGVDID
jgi:hypothetical protein